MNKWQCERNVMDGKVHERRSYRSYNLSASKGREASLARSWPLNPVDRALRRLKPPRATASIHDSEAPETYGWKSAACLETQCRESILLLFSISITPLISCTVSTLCQKSLTQIFSHHDLCISPLDHPERITYSMYPAGTGGGGGVVGPPQPPPAANKGQG